jgi:hypothetical protein
MAPTVETRHRHEDDEQITQKRVELQDATGSTSVHRFEGSPGGPYEYAEDGDPTETVIGAIGEAVTVEWDADAQVLRETGADGSEA